MKKIIALLIATLMVVAFAACTTTPANETESETKESETVTDSESEKVDDVTAISFAEYAALDVSEGNKDVVIEAYVQDTESYWEGKASIYAQDKDGAYFIYKAALTQEQYDALKPGTKIRVTGEKTAWSGLEEIAEGAAVEILAGDDTFVAEAADISDKLANEAELKALMAGKISIKGAKVAAKNEDGAAFLFGWDGSGTADSDADVYFDVLVGDELITCVIEYYQASAAGAREAAQNLKVGDIIDIDGFLYWYNGAQPHVTAIAANNG